MNVQCGKCIGIAGVLFAAFRFPGIRFICQIDWWYTNMGIDSTATRSTAQMTETDIHWDMQFNEKHFQMSSS